MKSFLLATIVTGYIFGSEDPQRTLDQQYKAYVMAQQITPKEITKLKKRILSGKKLPYATQQFLSKNIAWDFIAQNTLSSYWEELNKKQEIGVCITSRSSTFLSWWHRSKSIATTGALECAAATLSTEHASEPRGPT